jgi:magnesium-protoporphyrin IX monomethyl ester (oxidative) cyclase
MLRVHLINMPFGTLDLPSLALTQLASRLNESFPDTVSTRISYLNHDFGEYLGVPLYQDIAYSADHFHAGVGEWFFRQSAFPHLPDNPDEYFSRYYYQHDPSTAQFRRVILERRRSLDTFLDSLIDAYQIDQADVVGFTSMFAQNLASFSMARRLKARNPRLTTVMGGANCESPMGDELARHIDMIDYVFLGPALVSFPTFIQYTLNGRADQRGVIRGVVRSQACSHHISVPLLNSEAQVGTIGEDLDINVPVPLDYDSFLDNFERHFATTGLEPALLFETSRGCWWGEHHHCTFCGLNGLGMMYRAMSPDSALRYLRHVLRYTSRCSRFMCVDNIMPKNFVRDVWPSLENVERALLFYEVKANLTADDLAVLSKAGVKKIQPGIEALTTSTLQLMKKGSSGCNNVRFLMNCIMSDVSPVWNILVGFPGETASVFEKYAEDIPKLAHIPPPVGVFPVRFDRYSPYFDKAEEYRLELRPFDFYELIYPFDAKAISNLAYYFSDDSMSDYQLAMLEWIDVLKQKITAWRARWIGAQDEPPRLYAGHENGRMTVVDTRFTPAWSDMVAPEVAWLLTYLQRPRRIDETLAALYSSFGAGAGGALEVLRERQWVFEDRERIVGLVMEREPPSITAWIS